MRPLILTCLCVFALVTPVQAQDPQVDPDSPAGTEYQLPIDRAREEAGASSGGSNGSGGSQKDTAAGEAPLFGAGVEEKTGSGNETSGTGSDPPTTSDIEPESAKNTAERVRAQAPAPETDGSGLAAIGGGAAGVLLLGILAGLLLRRRARS